MLLELTTQNYTELLSGDLPVVLEFYSQTCIHCKRLEKSLEQLAKDYDGKAKIIRCDVYANMSLASEYDVHALPTLLFMKNGVVHNDVVGAVPPIIIEEEIKKLL